MITTSNSPVKGSGIPNQLLGAGLHTIGMSGLSRVMITFSADPSQNYTSAMHVGHYDRRCAIR
jgi:hypothetical protein